MQCTCLLERQNVFALSASAVLAHINTHQTGHTCPALRPRKTLTEPTVSDADSLERDQRDSVQARYVQLIKIVLCLACLQVGG